MNWSNQFAAVPESERCRTTIELPRKLESQIKQYESKVGVLQITNSILLTKLSDELAKSNLTAGDRAAYQHAVAECVIRLPEQYYPAASSTDGRKRKSVVKPTARSVGDSSVKAVG